MPKNTSMRPSSVRWSPTSAEERRERRVVLVGSRPLPQVSRCKPPKRRVEDDQVETAVDVREHVALAHIDAVGHTVAFGVVACALARPTGSRRRRRRRRLRRREDRIHSTARAHVEDAIGSRTSDEHHVRQHVGHALRRMNLGGNDEVRGR